MYILHTRLHTRGKGGMNHRMERKKTESDLTRERSGTQRTGKQERDAFSGQQREDSARRDLTPEERQRILRKRRRQRELERRRRRVRIIVSTAAGALAVVLLVSLVIVPLTRRDKGVRVEEPELTAGSQSGPEVRTDGQAQAHNAADSQAEPASRTGGQPDSAVQAAGQEDASSMQESEVLAKAQLYAAQYDYDRAMDLIRQVPDYESREELTGLLASCQEKKDSCQPYPVDKITHVFFHSMIEDPARAFDGDIKQDDYNQVMTTVSEYNKIIDSMYEKGYVLVSLHDIAKVDDQGIMHPQEILLPPGKIPFVLSQDDVSYYHYMDGDGYATKLILDENGEVKKITANVAGQLQRDACMIYPPFPQKAMKIPDIISFGMKYVNRSDITRLLVLAFVGTLTGLLIPFMNEQAYDKFIPMGNAYQMKQLGAILLACTLGNVSFRIVKNLATFRSMNSMKYSNINKSFQKL